MSYTSVSALCSWKLFNLIQIQIPNRFLFHHFLDFWNVDFGWEYLWWALIIWHAFSSSHWAFLEIFRVEIVVLMISIFRSCTPPPFLEFHQNFHYPLEFSCFFSIYSLEFSKFKIRCPQSRGVDFSGKAHWRSAMTCKVVCEIEIRYNYIEYIFQRY